MRAEDIMFNLLLFILKIKLNCFDYILDGVLSPEYLLESAEVPLGEHLLVQRGQRRVLHSWPFLLVEKCRFSNGYLLIIILNILVENGNLHKLLHKDVRESIVFKLLFLVYNGLKDRIHFGDHFSFVLHLGFQIAV
jgi:hypothetical protein